MKEVILDFNAEMWDIIDAKKVGMLDEVICSKTSYEEAESFCYENNFLISKVLENEE